MGGWIKRVFHSACFQHIAKHFRGAGLIKTWFGYWLSRMASAAAKCPELPVDGILRNVKTNPYVALRAKVVNLVRLNSFYILV